MPPKRSVNDDRLLLELADWADAYDNDEAPPPLERSSGKRRVIDDEDDYPDDDDAEPLTRGDAFFEADQQRREQEERGLAIERWARSSQTPKRPDEDELEPRKRAQGGGRDFAADARGRKRGGEDDDLVVRRPRVALPPSPKGFTPLASTHVRNMQQKRAREQQGGQPRRRIIDDEMETSALASGSQALNDILRSHERDISLDTANPDHWNLGVSSPFLRDEQKWLDHITDNGRKDALAGWLVTDRLPRLKFNLATKNIIWADGQIVGVQWRGSVVGTTDERTFVIVHLRKTYPNSSVLFIQNTYRKVLEYKLW